MLGPLGLCCIAVSRPSACAAVRSEESFRRSCGVAVASLNLQQSVTESNESDISLTSSTERRQRPQEVKHVHESRAMKTEGIEGTERFVSPGKGRGLSAIKHFKVGDLVFACPAYAYVLTVNERGGHCEFCFTRSALHISHSASLCGSAMHKT